jgi:hypothetical protein
VAKIGHNIERDPHGYIDGDASRNACGAVSWSLGFWFYLPFCKEIRHAAKNLTPDLPGYVHINQLEFITLILELVASKVWLSTLSEDQRSALFPHGMPNIPVLSSGTDSNVSKSWGTKITSASPKGQGLISVYAEVLRMSDFSTKFRHIPGIENIVPDDISRPKSHLLDLPLTHIQQLYQKHPALRTLSFFLPSPELLQLLSSMLSTQPPPGPPRIPKNLGRFVPGSSITTCSALTWVPAGWQTSS